MWDKELLSTYLHIGDYAVIFTIAGWKIKGFVSDIDEFAVHIITTTKKDKHYKYTILFEDIDVFCKRIKVHNKEELERLLNGINITKDRN